MIAAVQVARAERRVLEEHLGCARIELGCARVAVQKAKRRAEAAAGRSGPMRRSAGGSLLVAIARFRDAVAVCEEWGYRPEDKDTLA